MTARILDAFCTLHGSATEGYKLAIPGVHVTGVDADSQLDYAGNCFVQADAVQFIVDHGREFDFIHASPPFRIADATEHPDLIAPARAALLHSRRPFVIESAEAAAPHLFDPIELCGSMFGRSAYRHRLFEAGGGFELPRRLHLRHPDKRVDWWLPVREEMPPVAYTAWIGSLLPSHLGIPGRKPANAPGRTPIGQVGYGGAHSRVKRARGPARAFACACGARAEHWAYDHLDPRELVYQRSAQSRRLPYSLNPVHYIPMCRKCHKAFDGRDRQEERRREFAARDAEGETDGREQATA